MLRCRLSSKSTSIHMMRVAVVCCSIVVQEYRSRISLVPNEDNKNGRAKSDQICAGLLSKDMVHGVYDIYILTCVSETSRTRMQSRVYAVYAIADAVTVAVVAAADARRALSWQG